MRIEPVLLDILACPIDKQGLLYLPDEALLYNPRLRRAYRVADGYLMMLADRAEPVPPDEHDRLMKRAGHGEAIGTAGLAPDAAAYAAAGTREGGLAMRDSRNFLHTSLRSCVPTLLTAKILTSIMPQTPLIVLYPTRFGQPIREEPCAASSGLS